MPIAPQWLDSWWPSTRLRKDPLAGLLVDGRYRPVSVANWKLTPRMKERLLRARVAQPLTFSREKRLTIVIPYRDREAHLQRLLPVLRDQLTRQELAAKVLVVEQNGRDLFNRGKLLNVGMEYAARHPDHQADYFCLHDVDAVPVTANYLCPSQPLRLVHQLVIDGAGAKRADYRTDYYFSGAVSVTRDQALAANGFSNHYRGWGKEDDDFFFRLLLAGSLCYFDSQGVFEDLPNPQHQQVQRKSADTPPHVRINRQRRSRLLRGLDDPQQDGLSTLTYALLGSEQGDGYEKICVDL